MVCNFRLDRAAMMMDIGMTVQLKTQGVEKGEKVRWHADRSDILSVDQHGRVTALRNGEAYVSAHTSASTVSCKVTVGFSPQNPYIPPTWELFIADGEPHVFDGKMYIFGSRDCPEGFLSKEVKKDWCSPDYHVIWSEDLIHWNDSGVAISIENIPPDIRGTGNRLWAPDLFKSPVDGRYYLLFCTNGADIFIADSDCPTGPFGNIRRILIGDQEIKTIDPAGLVDEDGSIYIALPGDFFIAKLDPKNYSVILPETKVDLRTLISTSDPDYYPFEGPSLRKENDLYYYIYIASRKGEYVPTRMDYLVSEDPCQLSKWRYGGSIIETRDFIRAGNIHGSWAEFRGAYYLSYHRMAPGYKKFTRTMNLDRLFFDEKGSVLPVIRTSSGAKGDFLPGDIVLASSACMFGGGRDDDRFCHLWAEDPMNTELYGSACLEIIEGADVLYRYFYFENNAETIYVKYKCTDSVCLEVTLRSDQEEKKNRYTLPLSENWCSVSLPLEPIRGRFDVSFELRAQTGVVFYLAKFIIT